MDYSKTVNLPQTDFPMKANLPQREPAFQKIWEDEKLYEKIKEKNKGKKKFVLHDGPPYANGHIHLGTSLNKVLKDFIVKYKAMSGFYAPYTPGWDCHGLPIEQQAMKEMKVDKHKADRVQFRKAAAAFANKFIDIQRKEFKRLGVLGDWERPYLTLDPKYESTIVKVFGDLVKGGYVYRKNKPVYWCPTCETALADAEVEYAEHESHSVAVKFGVKSLPEALVKKGVTMDSTSVLIWTTTPWTLPANVALAFQPEADYVKAKFMYADGTSEFLIMAKRLMPVVAERAGVKAHEVVNEFTGGELEKIVCRNPLLERDSVGVLADYVTLEDGTGVVHIAPGHGQEDYLVGLTYNLPILSPVDDRGAFTAEAPEDLRGHRVFAANHLIIDKLKASKHLLYDDKLNHQYPHCWRCKKPIIFRATPQWFMSVEHDGLRGRMLKTIKDVTWIPGYGENRIGGMVEVRPDWCLSRQRLWGVPIPVFYCEKCKEPLLDDKVISHIAGLFSKSGSDAWFERSAQELLAGVHPSCSRCGNDTFRKEEDILDVWFDSGVSSEAVLASGNYEGLSWPADMYLEGSDQHRGWFQTSLIPAVAVKGGAPYKTVLTHGFVVDGEGKKMSKSLGNTILPEQIINQYGADILRLWVATSDYREDIRISPEIIKGLVDTYRKVRNTLRFLLGNVADLSPSKAVRYEQLREVDRHALHTLQDVTRQVTSAYETYEFHRAAVAINNFCTVYLSGFYLDILKDTLYCDPKESPSRLSAQSALWEICSTLTRLLAPILSFTAEEAWTELRKKDSGLPESVFLSEYPKEDATRVFSGELAAKWDRLFGAREKALRQFEALRKDKKIGSNLEAHLDIFDPGELSDIDFDLLRTALGTWDVTLNKGESGKPLEVAARPSGYIKCERCWRRTEDTKAVEKHGGSVCCRCAGALDEVQK